MYVNTNMVHARAQKGWWRAVSDTEIKHKLVYDPERLGSSGATSLRRWAKKGYCDRPTGEQAAYWQMHMWTARADYIAKLYSTFAEIIFLNPARVKVLKDTETLMIYEAKLKLIAAARDRDESRVYMTGPDGISQYDVFKLTGTGLRSSSMVTIRRNGWGCSVRDELEALIGEIGPPLSPEYAAQFKESIKSPLTLNVTVTDEYAEVKPRNFRHRTITRVSR